MEFKIPNPSVEAVFISASQMMDWGILKNNIPSLWSKTQGEGVRVAILDAGSPDHTDIRENILEAKTFIEVDSKDSSLSGHGLFCTGVIAASNNEYGIVGVAPKVSIMFYKVLKASGAGKPESILNGMKYAMQNNADIISLSFGARQDVPEIHKIVCEAHAANIVMVAAAGNDKVDDSVNYPAKYEEVISVGAVDEYNKIPDFCSKGYKIDVYAPGVSITSTYFNNSYACMSGTSFATPFVAGLIALAISLRRKLKKPVRASDIIKMIKTTPINEFVEKYAASP